MSKKTVSAAVIKAPKSKFTIEKLVKKYKFADINTGFADSE